MVLKVPREFRRGGRADDEAGSVASGKGLIQLMSRHLGVESLEGLDVLDMGCGTKLVQAILKYDLPVRSYVGIDVYKSMIEFLKEHVSDSRFAFHALNTHNEMYNPDGEPLTEGSRLPLEEHSFDLICLFSVFTHLAPHDYVVMLKLLNRYIRPGGHLIYSLFVNEATAGGHGLIDGMLPYIEAQLDDEELKKRPAEFVDWDPDKPLLWATYSREHALALVEGTGWKVASLNDPEECIQHYMICRQI